MTVAALVPEVRGGLGVNASYDDDKIPALIRRNIKRLLRDYHFPKAVQRAPDTVLALNDNVITLPVGFKKELEVRLFDPTDSSWSAPLTKRERFQLPYPAGRPYYYWLQGQELLWDTPIDASRVGWKMVLWYESMDVPPNEDWMTDDFEDAVRLLSITRGAAEFRKPEVLQTYAPLWQDEQQSLAIYLNELEWNNAEIMMKEAKQPNILRYPI